MNEDTKSQRVRWTTEEQRKLAESVLNIYLKDTTNIWRYVAEAQKSVLPADRQRPIMGANAVNDAFLEIFEEVRQEFLNEGIAIPVEITIEKEVPVQTPREELLASITPTEMWVLVGKMLGPFIDSMGKIPSIIEKSVQPSTPPARKEIAPTPFLQVASEPKKRLPKVLIAEFLPQQEEDIRRKAKDFQIELVFVGKGWREKVPPSCNWFIVNRKVSHSTTNRMQRDFNGEHMFVVNGITEAMKALADINARVHGPQGK